MSYTSIQHSQNPLNSLRQAIAFKLDTIELQSTKTAHLLCRLIPSQCPFERDIHCFGLRLIHIPPLCKLNPFYEQFVGLRFRALSYLADQCGEDITRYLSKS